MRITRMGRAWLQRFAAIQGGDRAIALGGQAFAAMFPLLIVYASLAPGRDGRDFADDLIDRLDLEGAAAASLRQAFAPREDVDGNLTVVGFVFLVVAALSFTRTLQRLYEQAHGLRGLGLRGTPYGLAWLAVLAIVLVVRPIVAGAADGPGRVALNLVVSTALWLATPYVLLGRRLPWQRLVPGALLTAVAMTGFGAASLVWVPDSVESSSAQFGLIGVAFALLAWLIGAGFVLVFAVTGGAVLEGRATKETARIG